MITITITSDESLADPHFDVLHRACREVAENTGQLVHVKAEFTIAPALIAEAYRHPATPIVVEKHEWPALDEEESAQYLVGGANYSNSSNGSAVKDSLTDGWIDVIRGCGIAPDIPETATVDIKLECGDILHDRYAAESNWGWPIARERVIIAYRVHKPEVKASISTTESMLLKDQAN